MPEDRPMPATPVAMDVGGLVADHSSAASDSGSESGPVTESLRERRLRELQLQVCESLTVSICESVLHFAVTVYTRCSAVHHRSIIS